MPAFSAIENIRSAFSAIKCEFDSIAHVHLCYSLYSTIRFSYQDSLFRPFDILETMEISGFITYFIFVAAFTIGWLLIGLLWWHGRMIGQGVTSLERVLNQVYARQCYEQGFIFVNPYDFGRINNWKRFLGAFTIGEFVRRVLWPSTHKPLGNGVTWDGFNVNTNLQGHSPTIDSHARPMVCTPGLAPMVPGSYYPVNRHRPIIPPWENQPKVARTSPGYQPRAPSISTAENKKEH
jgi:hypothetical protein